MLIGKKGLVSIENCRGRIRLRWPYQGKRISLSIGQYDALNNLKAEIVALQIGIDLGARQYDETLQKYRKLIDPDYEPRVNTVGVLDLFKDFYKYRSSNLEPNSKTKYEALQNRLALLGNKKATQVTEQLAEAFISSLSQLSIETRRSYLALLKACWDYGRLRHDLTRNPWDLIRLPRAEKPEPDPFTLAEVQQILAGFAGTHYYKFVCTLLALGCRPGEASALTWGDFDWDAMTVQVNKSWDGRSVKTTKTRKSRVVPLIDSLKTLLYQDDLQPDALAFPAPKGGFINLKIFLRRYWRPTLDRVGVRYRPTYHCRHTVWSFAVLQMPIAEAAKNAGNLPSTLLRNYIGSVSASPMPDLLKIEIPETLDTKTIQDLNP